MSLWATIKIGGRVRYLLLGSLMLNLAFVGAAGAMALQHTRDVPLQPVLGIGHHGVEHRFDHLLARLPAHDATIMRAMLRADAVKLATAEAQIRLSQVEVRDSLRAQPFDPAAVRTAMAETSRAHDHLFQLVHSALATATAEMSPAGRQTIADWPQRRDNLVVRQ
ncbi:MAG: periplasmic heavy metal sensor [Xanthobacteraceae bacterium]